MKLTTPIQMDDYRQPICFADGTQDGLGSPCYMLGELSVQSTGQLLISHGLRGALKTPDIFMVDERDRKSVV